MINVLFFLIAGPFALATPRSGIQHFITEWESAVRTKNEIWVRAFHPTIQPKELEKFWFYSGRVLENAKSLGVKPKARCKPAPDAPKATPAYLRCWIEYRVSPRVRQTKKNPGKGRFLLQVEEGLAGWKFVVPKLERLPPGRIHPGNATAVVPPDARGTEAPPPPLSPR